MKRKNEEPQQPARKSTRKRAKPQRFGASVKEEVSVPQPKRPYDVFQVALYGNHISSTTDTACATVTRYNTLLSFLPDSAAARVQTDDATVEKSSKRIDAVLRRAYKEIAVEEGLIRERESQLSRFVLNDTSWYERGDLLCKHCRACRSQAFAD